MQRANNSSVAGGGGIGTSKSKPKKFCTRGEEFFELLKSLGYQPSKHQQAEHFEYLFQDERSEKFVRKLMSTLKTENCLLPEDVQRYEELKKQGLTLYGSDLEEAVARRRAINELHNRKKEKRSTKLQEMEDVLNKEIGDVQTIAKYRDDIFMKEVVESQTRQTKLAYRMDVVQRLIQEYEKGIDVDVKLLNEKTDELEATVVEFKKKLNPMKSKDTTQYLCQVEVASIMEREEMLLEKLQQMITKHGTELIMKDAGYAVEGDPLNEESVHKIFVQYEKDFDRLKHCIVHERVRQISLQLSLAGQQGYLESMNECYKRAAKISLLDFDTRAKLQMQIRDNINDATTALEQESGSLEHRVREIGSCAVNRQFSAIMNIKARAKRKLQDFFSLTTNVLKAQKIRISLLRNLVKSEARIYGRLINNIEANIAASSAHSKKLAWKSPNPASLSLEGCILKYIFSLFGVDSPDIISSVPKVHFIVSNMLKELEYSSQTCVEESRAQLNTTKQHLDKTVQVLKDVQQSVAGTSKSALQTNLLEKEKKLKESKEELDKLRSARLMGAKEQQNRRALANQKLMDLIGG